MDRLVVRDTVANRRRDGSPVSQDHLFGTARTVGRADYARPTNFDQGRFSLVGRSVRTAVGCRDRIDPTPAELHRENHKLLRPKNDRFAPQKRAPTRPPLTQGTYRRQLVPVGPNPINTGSTERPTSSCGFRPNPTTVRRRVLAAQSLQVDHPAGSDHRSIRARWSANRSDDPDLAIPIPVQIQAGRSRHERDQVAAPIGQCKPWHRRTFLADRPQRPFAVIDRRPIRRLRRTWSDGIARQWAGRSCHACIRRGTDRRRLAVRCRRPGDCAPGCVDRIDRASHLDSSRRPRRRRSCGQRWTGSTASLVGTPWLSRRKGRRRHASRWTPDAGGPAWAMRREMMSPRYTVSWDDLPTAA